MVGLHHAHQPVSAIYHRQRMQIVLVEAFRDFILVRFGRTGNDAGLGQNSNPRLREGQDQQRQRDDAFERLVFPGEIDFGYAFYVTFELTQCPHRLSYGAARGPRYGTVGIVGLIGYFIALVTREPIDVLPARLAVVIIAGASAALVYFVVLPERPQAELDRLRHAIRDGIERYGAIGTEEVLGEESGTADIGAVAPGDTAGA